MVIYIDHTSGSQFLMTQGRMLTGDEAKEIKGKVIKNIQKIDGKIMLTLK